MCDFIFESFFVLCFMYTKQSQLQLLAALSNKQARSGGSTEKNGTFIVLKKETGLIC